MKQLITSIFRVCKSAIGNIIFYIIERVAPKTYAGILYKKTFGKPIDWKTPCDINEKINWMKFYSDTSKWTLLTDKYRVREYVESCGLGHMLVKLYGKWNQVENIDWKQLPNQFIMKMNNGSGDVFICKDKDKLNVKECMTHFKKFENKKFGYNMAEPHYKKIEPCIIAEELLDAKKQPIETSSLIDYKIWSFDGNPVYILACYNRTPHSVEVGVYDTEWNFHPEFSNSTQHYILGNPIPKPQALDQMLEAAATLSKGFPQVRVDMYEVGGKAFFGELTFTSMGGFMDYYTPEFLKILGSYITNVKA